MTYGARIAAIYDLYFPHDRSPEARQWAALAGPAPARLLEPMVGTAEVALELCRNGYEVTGIDLSAPMLDVAEQRQQQEAPAVAERLTLICGDVCTVTLPEGAFDLAYVGNGSWHLLTEPGQRAGALQMIRRALKPGGRLALQLFGPLTGSGRSEPRSFRPLRPAPVGWDVVKTNVTERDADRQVLTIYELLQVNGQVTENRLVLQLLTPEQIRVDLAAAGFGTVTISESMLVVAE